MNVDDCSRQPICPLGELHAIRPDEAWERRLHAKCVTALTRDRRPGGVLASHVVDAAFVTAVSLYVLSVVATALALVGAG